MTDYTASIYKIIGERVASFRKFKKLSQEQLGKKANIGRTSITNIESGKQQVSIHTLIEICKVLNVEIQSVIPLDIEIEARLKTNPQDKLSNSLQKQHVEDNLKNTIMNIESII